MRSGVPGNLPAAGPRACARVQNKRKTGGRTVAAREVGGVWGCGGGRENGGKTGGMKRGLAGSPSE